jgi:hypothetical protein
MKSNEIRKIAQKIIGSQNYKLKYKKIEDVYYDLLANSIKIGDY